MPPRSKPISKDPTAKVEQTPLEQLLPHPMNPRRGNIDKIVESIKVNGWFGVIVAQKSTKYILAGNHRWQAARQLGIESVPVMWLDCSNAEGKKILLADNKMNDMAGYANDTLQELLRSVLADDDLRGTGFDATDIEALVDEVTDEPDDKRKRNLEPFHDTFFLVRCPITEQGRVMQLLTNAMQEIEGVEIASATN
jgi:hypothetical protein